MPRCSPSSVSRSTAYLGSVREGGQELRVLRTPFVLLDRLGTALDAEQVALVLKVLAANAITYVVFKGDGDDASRYYDAILDIAGDGTWQWKSLREPHASEPESSDSGRGSRQPNSPR